jgi:Flp pilus assembly protein TadD
VPRFVSAAEPPHGIECDLSEQYLAALHRGFHYLVADGEPAALHQAMGLFALATLMDDGRPESRLGLALCYANLGDEERALLHFDACLELGFGGGDYPQLVYEYDDEDGQTWTVDIGRERVLAWRTGCCVALNRCASARQDLALLADSSDRDVQAEIAILWAKLLLAENDLDGAQRHLSRALGLDPEEPEAHFVRACIHERRGDVPAAIKAFSRAVRLDPQDPEYRIGRARVYLACGERDRAQTDQRAAEAILAGRERSDGERAAGG